MTHSAPESRAARALREIFQSGRPLSYIRSSEELRIGRLLAELALPVWTWSLTEGLHLHGEKCIFRKFISMKLQQRRGFAAIFGLITAYLLTRLQLKDSL